MHERQLIFESVMPSELDPARFSKPIIDGIEQDLTGKTLSMSRNQLEFERNFQFQLRMANLLYINLQFP